MADLNLSDLFVLAVRHPEVPAVFLLGSLLLGAAARSLSTRWGWAPVPAVLAGCGLALALAVTLVRPFGQFPAGGLNPLATVRECTVGSLSLARTYEKLNVAMLVPFAFFGTLATRRPTLVGMACLLVSGSVEFLQGATGGGTCQARDVVHNTLGGLLGAGLAGLWSQRRRQQRRTGRMGRMSRMGRMGRTGRVSADRGAGPGRSP